MLNKVIKTVGEPTPDDEKVSIRFQSHFAVIYIDNPPVNAGSWAVRKGIVHALAQAVEKDVAYCVIVGVGKNFSAGSDVSEFGKKLEKPEVPDVIKALEDTPFPVIAALSGVALGGGLELSLGCDYRVALNGTMVGLPEVLLGMIPGAGGTQRLPRLVGKTHALDLISSGRRIDAVEASQIGLVDHVVDGDLLAGVVNFMSDEQRPKRVCMALDVPHEDTQSLDEALKAARKKSKGRPNIQEAIRLVCECDSKDGALMLQEERAVFNQLRMGEDAFALRYLFFAEKKATRFLGVDKTCAKTISNVGVIGGGTMGQGIVKSLLNSGLKVILVERDALSAEKSVAAIRASYDQLVHKGHLDQDEANKRFSGLTGSADLSSTNRCDLVIEAVFEDMDVKRKLFRSLEDVLNADTLIATNTSYLDIDKMVEKMSHPERVLGLHFFSPADRMKLLEVVKTDKTDEVTLASGLKLAQALAKQPVLSKVAEGFIGNRVYAAYRRRAELLLLDGAHLNDIDTAIKNFGFAMGPFEVADLSGLDIAWAMRKRQAPSRDPLSRYVAIADYVCQAGRLGRKTGKGWYSYETGRATYDPAIEDFITQDQERQSIVPKVYSEEAITRQLLITMVNEASLLLDEGIAHRPSDVDVVLANGYGFPRWAGGPLYWASQQSEADLENDLGTLAAEVGHGLKIGPVREILKQMNEEASKD